jgi:hypothetical protein
MSLLGRKCYLLGHVSLLGIPCTYYLNHPNGCLGLVHSFVVHGCSLLGSFLLIMVPYFFLIIVYSCAPRLRMETNGWRLV